jgi:FkbM family methyltransferase
MYAGLKRLAKAGFRPKTVLDVGAAVGGWTEWCQVYFPEANYLLFEPVDENRARLQRLKSARPNVDFVIAAAGAKCGRIGFNIAPNLTGSQVADDPAGDRLVTLTTIDHEVSERSLTGPFLLKLDTHGFELPILEGATQTLARTEVVIAEVYNFKIGENCSRFARFTEHMETLGFRVFDVLEPVRRPGDDALWQMDFVFRRADYRAFSQNSYWPTLPRM